jgi:steroid delta-isomerase-like uncharacterized protein
MRRLRVIKHGPAVTVQETSMSDPKAVVLQYIYAFNRGDVNAVCKLFTEDALIWGVLGWGTVEQARSVWRDLVECLQIQFQVDAIIAEGSTVAVRFTERGKSVRAFRGAGPTGRRYELRAMEWFEIEGNLIRRRWGARDSAAQNRQLGFAQ